METHFRLFIEGTLLTASWVERLQEELGLKGASQVWGEAPSWLMWFQRPPGAYGLSLALAEELPSGVARGLFALKYYPRPDEADFAGFSAQERALVQGSSFDHTGTPVFEAQDQIPPGFFSLASLEVFCRPGHDWALFTLAGLDQCRQRGRDGGQVLRRVPGWRLARGFGDALLSMHAFCHKTLPARAQLTRSPGFEHLADDSGQLTPAPAPDLSLYTLSVLFEPHPDQPHAEALELMDQELAEPEANVIYRQEFACGHFHGPQNDLEPMPPVSPDWWRLSQADYKSHLASSCGCEH